MSATLDALIGTPRVAEAAADANDGVLAVIAAQADGSRDEAFARLVATILRLAGGSAEQKALEPAALILAREGVLDSGGVTFGCDYFLNVHSIELRRGFAYARARNWLTWEGTHLQLRETAETLEMNDGAATVARAVFALSAAELQRRARRLLLAE